MTKKSVFKRQAAKGVYITSYSLYDTCDVCPLSVYIDLICNDNLRALIKYGTPKDEVLQEAKLKLCAEFAELSGDETAKAIFTAIRDVYMYQSQVALVTVVLNLLKSKISDGLPYLKSIGLNVAMPKRESDYVQAIKRVNGFLKGRVIRYKEAYKQYELLSKGNGKSKGIKSSDFTDILVHLSKNAGFRLTTDISLAEYASYLKLYKKDIENGSNRRHK